MRLIYTIIEAKCLIFGYWCQFNLLFIYWCLRFWEGDICHWESQWRSFFLFYVYRCK